MSRNGPALISDEKVKEILFDELPFRSEVRKTVLEDAYEEGSFSFDSNAVNYTVAFWANEVLSKYFGSRDWGFKLKTSQYDEHIWMRHDTGQVDWDWDYSQEFRKAHSDLEHLGKREFKNDMVLRLTAWITVVVQDALRIDEDLQWG